MPTPVQCPACQHAFAVAEHYLGKRGRCPKCGLIFKAEPVLGDDDVGTFPEIPLSGDVPQVPIPKRLAALAAKGPPPLGPPAPPPIVGGASPPLTELAHSEGAPPALPPASTPLLITERTEYAKRTKPRSLVTLLLLAFGGGTALAVAAVLGLIFLSQASKNEADNEAQPGDVVAVVEPAAPLLPLLEIEPLIKLRSSVLLMDVTTPQGKHQASCFVLDDQGHVATSWQAVGNATKVEALGPIGVRIPIPGAVAIDPAHDLAILKLAPRVPLDFNSFKLSEKISTATMPIGGFELAATDSEVRVGRATLIATLGKLPASVRTLVKRGMTPWSDDTVTMSHDMPLPASSAGSPLVNDAGEVVAIHALNDQAAGSLAVGVQHLALLLAHRSDDLMPWPIAADIAQVVVPADLPGDAPQVASTEANAANEAEPNEEQPKPEAMPKEEDEGDGAPKLPPAPGDEDVVENLLPFPKNDPVDTFIAKIQEFQTECAKLKWQPTNAREYAQFQLLATNITAAVQLADSKEDIAPEPVKARLAEFARNALSSLPAEEFPSDKAWETTNKLAEEGLKVPGEGIFALGRVIIPATDGQLLGKEVGTVLELVGTKQLIAMHVTKDVNKFTADAKILIVGVHDPNIRVKVEDKFGPAMVICKHALLVGKPK